MSTKNRKVLALGLGLLSSLGLCCYIIFKPVSTPSAPPEFDQTLCQKPCWHGLQVGVSTKQDVQDVLGTYEGDLSKIKITNGEYLNGDFIKIEFHIKSETQIISFYFLESNGDIVDRISLHNTLTMKQALTVFGEPDGVILFSYPFLLNYSKKGIKLYYPEKGLRIECHESTSEGPHQTSDSGKSPCVDIEMVDMVFFDSKNFSGILVEDYGDADLALKYIRPYQGLDVIYPIMEGSIVPP